MRRHACYTLQDIPSQKKNSTLKKMHNSLFSYCMETHCACLEVGCFFYSQDVNIFYSHSIVKSKYVSVLVFSIGARPWGSGVSSGHRLGSTELLLWDVRSVQPGTLWHRMVLYDGDNGLSLGGVLSSAGLLHRHGQIPERLRSVIMMPWE